jgi:predicted secreted Zn-dependent protease
MIRTIFPAMLLLAASPAMGQTAASQTPAALAAIPGVTVKWYDVAGTTPEQIRKSKKAARPASPDDPSQRFDVLSTWRIDTSWATESTAGACRIVDAQAKFSAVVSLPRLAPAEGQDEKLRADWAGFVDSLAVYEARFLGYAADHASDVSRTIAASSCAKVNAASSAGIAAVASDVAALRAKSRPVKGLF